MLRRTTHAVAGPHRVVVETDDPALQICDFVAFADAGFDVVVCGGPDAGHPCGAVAGAGCALVDEADVVFNDLRDPAVQRRVAAAVRETAPAVPMVVRVAPGCEDTLPAGCEPLTSVTSLSGQTAALRRAVTHEVGAQPPRGQDARGGASAASNTAVTSGA